MQKYFKYILGVFAAILGMFFYERGKRRSAEALLGNQATKEKALKIDEDSEKHSAALELESQLRAQDLNATKEKLSKEVSKDDLADFLHNPTGK